eukprot:5653343-Alexandrium_andersonii.AAC.1
MAVTWLAATSGAVTVPEPFELPALSRERLGRVVRRAAHTAAGADGWTPREWTYLSELAVSWLAKLLQIVEEGA